ncbi:MAG: histidine phosphatase family protein [Caldilineales bacterium]|nr:histidine phosphatase family protein [Caldilineales bacterium]
MNPNQIPTTLLLVRHGETDANVTGTWQGATDSPLNELGQAQARAIAMRLQASDYDITAIYSSPLGRARQTAQIIADEVGLHTIATDPNLAEYNLGEWEGLTYRELRFDRKLWDKMASDPHFAPPGGESAVGFAMRLVEACRTIARNHPGEAVVIVSHGGAIATALSLLIEQDGSVWPKYQMDNCALAELVMDATPRLTCLNDVSHLGDLHVSRTWNMA